MMREPYEKEAPVRGMTHNLSRLIYLLEANAIFACAASSFNQPSVTYSTVDDTNIILASIGNSH